MSSSAIEEIQKSLNTIRNIASKENAQTRLQALQLLLSTSESIVQLTRRMDSDVAKTKTRTKKVAIPQTKVIRQNVPTAAKGSEQGQERDLAAQKPQSPLTPQQQREQ
jgi:hypothetical protein